MGLEEDIKILLNLSTLVGNKTVDIVFVRSINRLDIGGEVIEDKVKGSSMKTTLKTAMELIEKGYATIPDEYITWIKKIIWKEKSRESRKSLPKEEDSFYPKIALIIYAIKHDKNLELDENTKLSITNQVRHIISRRLQLIISEAFAKIDHLVNNMTPEEHLLARIINSVITEWREGVYINELL